MLSKSKPQGGVYSFARWISCSRRVYNSNLTPDENRRAYGPECSEEGLGANLQFFFYFQIPIEGETANWKELESQKDSNKLIAGQFLLDWDHQFLNEETKLNCGQEVVPSCATIEVLAQIAFRKLKLLLPDLLCVSIREANKWVGECDNMTTAKYRRVFTVRCAHQHKNPQLSDSENQILFGKCASIHGHEYSLEIEVEGQIDPATGLVISRMEFENEIHEKVISPFQGELINSIIGNASGELILENIVTRLKKIPWNLRIALRETRKNSFFWGKPFRQPVQSSKL